MKDIEEIVALSACEYYGTKDKRKAIEMLVADYGKEAERGYMIVGFASDIGALAHIERVDVLSVYDTDIEAGRQAKKDGIKLIPYREQLKSAPYSYYRYIDTEENRKKMEELRKA